MSGPARLVLFGAGGIAATYFDAVASLPSEAALVAVVEQDEERRRLVGDRWGVETFATVDAFLGEAMRLDVVGAIVCTPPVSHAPLTLALLDAGVSVLCEKPMAPNRAGLHMMLACAARNQRLLMMASKFRYAEDLILAKKLIESGELGEIVLFRNAFTAAVDMRNRWNSVREVSGGGVIIDNGTHSVDIARYLLGPIREVVASETRRVQGLAVEDTAEVLFRTDTGATGTIDLSWSLQSGSQWFVTIDGTRGSMRLGWQGSEIDQGKGWEPIGVGYRKLDAFRDQLTDFVDAIRYGTTPRISSADAQASVAVIDAAYRSIELKAWVTVVEERRLEPR